MEDGSEVPLQRVTTTDDEFLAAFEGCSLPEGAFHHRDHIRLGWICVRRSGLPAALTRFSDGLRRFAASLGKTTLYHETITWAYLLLIHERMARDPSTDTWEGFAQANPDLLQWSPSILDSYYRSETLQSPLARATFLLPDRIA